MAGDAAHAQAELFWKVPLPRQCVQFVDSAESEAFSYLLLALEKASVIALDAEWKPVFDKGSICRVSILQIACRLRRGKPEETGEVLDVKTELEYDDEDESDDEVVGSGIESGSDNGVDLPMQVRKESQSKSGSKAARDGNKRDEAFIISQAGGEKEWKSWERLSPGLDPFLTGIQESTGKKSKSFGLVHLSSSQIDGKDGKSDTNGSAHHRKCEVSLDSLTDAGKALETGDEIIFLLDLLALPVSEFGKVLKEVFVDPRVLKLGFGFKQDLVNLRTTCTGPDYHGCFDKVEPYVDVGKLYRHLHQNKSEFTHRGRRMVRGSEGLASISETVLGLPLSKEMQCSNWEQRPLSTEQFDYAAADAYCLLAIFDTLHGEASKSWFSLTAAVGDDEDVPTRGSQVGVAGVLAPADGGFVGKGTRQSLGSICQPMRGNAAHMVEAALGKPALSRTIKEAEHQANYLKRHGTHRKALGMEALVCRFGEKLLISGGQSIPSKRIRRKTRSRRAREIGKSRELDEGDIQYEGPPPWDTVIGGDGVPKFLCDAMVEGLARQLRCVGIDAASPNSRKCEPRDLVDLAEKEGRIILTRDVKLLRRRLVPADLAYRVKRQGKWDQLAEIIEVFKLSIREDQLLSRCTKCNGDFIPKALNAEEAMEHAPWNQVIPDCALKNVNEFWQCSACKHLYWQGSQFIRAYKQFAAVCHTKVTVGEA